MPTLQRIILFPVKSLDGVAVARARILASGALEGDRRYAIADGDGKFVNGKREARVHALRAAFHPEFAAVTLEAPGATARTFRFGADRAALEDWLSNHFGYEVQVLESADGFPDDTAASGPTIVSQATTQAVAGWFPGLSADAVQRRFRANLELGGVPAFWEDQLFGAPGSFVNFRLGEVRFEGSNPCARCVVPTRDPVTAAAIADFQKTFMSRRQETLPNWAAASRFDHFYRLCVNTRIPRSEAGKMLHLGDELTVLGANFPEKETMK